MVVAIGASLIFSGLFLAAFFVGPSPADDQQQAAADEQQAQLRKDLGPIMYRLSRGGQFHEGARMKARYGRLVYLPGAILVAAGIVLVIIGV